MMSSGLALQYLVVALAVLVSLIVVMHKQFPSATRHLRIRLALPLARAGRPAWMHRLGGWLAPPAQASDRNRQGCTGCSASCAPPPKRLRK